ncbi:MAG: Re/Si-specific NAD(P)(+) transhydrogenase subunit alpha [Planctomycetota bacterium]
MIIGILKETYPGERRVALTPGAVATLTDKGFEVGIEPGAGAEAGFPDDEYVDKGATVCASRDEVFGKSDILCQVRTPGANPEHGAADLAQMKDGQIVIGHAEPLSDLPPIQKMAEAKITSFALELMPRITRAQSMDVLSSQATIGGYKAVVIAAGTLPKMFPMMMTAAGTIAPARVLIVGAGVAGLQAIASARRLGAVVSAYDIRPVVKEQVESLGATFVELELETETAEGAGGYAKAMDEDFYRRQQELMSKVVADCDVVITTAAVPGREAPVLVTAAMVEGMRPGSVIVDLAAERGGNCELTEADQTVVAHGVTIVGPSNLPATVPHHASQMYARNMSTFLLHLAPEGELTIDMDDEITSGTLLTRGGEIVNRMAREALGLDEPAPAEPEPEPAESEPAAEGSEG